MQYLSGNQRPHLLTSLMNMSLVLHLPRKMHRCRSSSNAPRLPWFLKMQQNPHVCSLLTRCTIPCACQAKRRFNVQKWREHVVFFLSILTSKCASRLRATTACTFLTSQLPKVVRTWGALYILTLKCALRHNGVHFFDISTSTTCSEPVGFLHFWLWQCASRHNGVQFLHLSFVIFATLRPSGATNHWKKHGVSRLSYLSAHLDLLSSETFSFWSSFFFSSLLFSDSSHLCFSFVHIVGSLTSKLPSIKIYCVQRLPDMLKGLHSFKNIAFCFSF